MPSEPGWLDAEALSQINATMVRDTGEPHLVLDLGLLESACARPRNIWNYDGDADATAQAIVDVITGATDEAWFCAQVGAHIHPA